jgi:phosphoglycerol transferase MdoB-like AlkP superfamily enzyme
MGAFRQKFFRFLLHPAVVIAAALIYFAAIRYFDTRWRFIPYTLAVSAALSSIVFLLSRRPVFSLYAGGGTILLITGASIVKYKLKGLSLHVYDLVFTGSDASAIHFLLSSYSSLFWSGLAVLALVLAFLMLLFSADKALAVSMRLRAGLALTGLILPFALYPPDRIEEPDYLPFISGYNASAFLVSLGQVTIPVGRIRLSDHTEKVTSSETFANTVECEENGKRPDIFLVLSETQTDPSIFPQITPPAGVVDSLKSADGKIHPLYVETFGGGTWVTNFSVLTGLSTADFGWQSPYVTQLMEGRIKGALPDILARCGYRTVTLMPMMFNFVNEGPFLKSIGFEDVIDAAAMGLKPDPMRDSHYFDFAEKLITEHRKTDKRPLFLAIQTIFGHSPYDQSKVTDQDLPPTVFSANAKANEYMRRVAMARQDFQVFLARRKAEPGERGSLVADFGDHQGEATRDFAFELDGGAHAFADFRSTIYRTYFALHGFGAELDLSSIRQDEDVAYLPARMIEAAKLPSSPVFRDLIRLSDLCGGRFHTCKERSEIDLHLKKRQNGGLLRLN